VKKGCAYLPVGCKLAECEVDPAFFVAIWILLFLLN